MLHVVILTDQPHFTVGTIANARHSAQEGRAVTWQRVGCLLLKADLISASSISVYVAKKSCYQFVLEG
jgi:hypothetical protein